MENDYSSLEMKVLALRAGDETMTEAFLNGADAHKNTASIVFEKPEEEVTADERQNSKAISFGLIYGKQTFSLAEDLGVSEREAEVIVDKYMKNKPEVNRFIQETHEFAEKHGYVDTMQGHRRLLQGVFGDDQSKSNALRQSVNTIIQGTGAYLTNYSVLMLDEFINENNLQSMLIATVHDSIVLDVHPDELPLMAQVVKTIMENLPIDFLRVEHKGEIIQYPITADVEIGTTYGNLVEFDLEEYQTFNSVEGYVRYHNDLDKINDYFESGKITEEQKDVAQDQIRQAINTYRQI